MRRRPPESHLKLRSHLQIPPTHDMLLLYQTGLLELKVPAEQSEHDPAPICEYLPVLHVEQLLEPSAAKRPAMQVHIKYFASIREAMGQSVESVDTQASTLGQLRDALVARGGPGAQALARDRVLRMALDQQLAEESAMLHAGCEVAFFPPVTGG